MIELPELNDYLSIHPCDCGRSYCKFFGPGIGERGRTFTASTLAYELQEFKEFVDELQAKAPEIIEHLTKLLVDFNDKDVKKHIKNYKLSI